MLPTAWTLGSLAAGVLVDGFSYLGSQLRDDPVGHLRAPDASPLGQIGSDLAKGLRLAVKTAAPLPRQSD
jgi:hypothetical protein